MAYADWAFYLQAASLMLEEVEQSARFVASSPFVHIKQLLLSSSFTVNTDIFNDVVRASAKVYSSRSLQVHPLLLLNPLNLHGVLSFPCHSERSSSLSHAYYFMWQARNIFHSNSTTWHLPHHFHCTRLSHLSCSSVTKCFISELSQPQLNNIKPSWHLTLRRTTTHSSCNTTSQTAWAIKRPITKITTLGG